MTKGINREYAINNSKKKGTETVRPCLFSCCFRSLRSLRFPSPNSLILTITDKPLESDSALCNIRFDTGRQLRRNREGVVAHQRTQRTNSCGTDRTPKQLNATNDKLKRSLSSVSVQTSSRPFEWTPSRRGSSHGAQRNRRS